MVFPCSPPREAAGTGITCRKQIGPIIPELRCKLIPVIGSVEETPVDGRFRIPTYVIGQPNPDFCDYASSKR
jgi:hypothetical protein